jgi:membrane-bound metal-dependent hydrolase YbcI (DUF457 family)
MFIGHYAAALALKKVEKKASLGLLFLAVQFVDILFFPLALFGIERFRVIPNYTESTHFNLEFMPYTHSLLASFIWAGLTYFAFKLFTKNSRVAMVMALAVLSHWFLDLIVHTPDLPLWSDSSPKLGLGLWNHAVLSYLLEAALLILGVWLYMKNTTAKTSAGKYGMIVFAAVLLIANLLNLFGPPPGDSKMVLAVTGLSGYFIFALAAFWLDKKRE